MTRKKLSAAEIAENIGQLKTWATDGEWLTKRFLFDDFAAALAFVNEVGAIAERHDHHPDIKLGWGYAEINLTTHDRNGLTELDFAAAREIEKIS